MSRSVIIPAKMPGKAARVQQQSYVRVKSIIAVAHDVIFVLILGNGGALLLQCTIEPRSKDADDLL